MARPCVYPRCKAPLVNSRSPDCRNIPITHGHRLFSTIETHNLSRVVDLSSRLTRRCRAPDPRVTPSPTRIVASINWMPRGPMDRRDMLRGAGVVAGATAVNAVAQSSSSVTPTIHKYKIVITGGYPGDPEYGCGGTVARFTAGPRCGAALHERRGLAADVFGDSHCRS